MNRRQVLKYAAGAAGLSVLNTAAAEGTVEFTPEIYSELLASGKPFMLGFHANWWSTCSSQKRTVSALLSKNPEYSAITIVNVDWDTHRKSALTKELKIRRRSTLLMFRGGEEIARVIAQTNEKLIEDMFKAALG